MSQFRPPALDRRSRYNGWLPANPAIHKSFIKMHVGLALNRAKTEPKHTEPVQTFANAINGSPVMKDLFDQIFLQASKENDVTDFETLLNILDTIIYQAPKYYKATDDQGNIIGEPVGVPMYLIFDLLSNTSAAYDLFRMTEFNLALKDLLNSWGGYLRSSTSNSTLNTGEEGWFGAEAMADFVPYITPLTFEATYLCPDPQAENRGFTSWDHFFTRHLQPKARPITDPDNNTLIHNACESTNYRIKSNVQKHDQFWLKDQKYSLYDILNRDPEYSNLFEGGTIYQAFLSPLDYHRWHSPVNGTIKKAVVLDGTYYAVLPDGGAPPDDPDLQPGDPHGALIRSQSFLTISAARSLIFIEADNPAIGLMCFVGVGMAEVSTCENLVEPGQRVSIGQELGMFHFGGSSHALIFRAETQIQWKDEYDRPIEENVHYWVNTPIGVVTNQ